MSGSELHAVAQAFLFQEHSPPPLLRLVDEDSGVELSNTEDKLESLQDLGVIAVSLLDVTAAAAPAGDLFDEAMPAMDGAGKRADARPSKNSRQQTEACCLAGSRAAQTSQNGAFCRRACASSTSSEASRGSLCSSSKSSSSRSGKEVAMSVNPVQFGRPQLCCGGKSHQ